MNHRRSIGFAGFAGGMICGAVWGAAMCAWVGAWLVRGALLHPGGVDRLAASVEGADSIGVRAYVIGGAALLLACVGACVFRGARGGSACNTLPDRPRTP